MTSSSTQGCWVLNRLQASCSLLQGSFACQNSAAHRQTRLLVSSQTRCSSPKEESSPPNISHVLVTAGHVVSARKANGQLTCTNTRNPWPIKKGTPRWRKLAQRAMRRIRGKGH
ncbi:hypothetical protein GQ53DRAFT_531300 [Thozetella sp. PMI_491]|nr:hypothetical protein GQ53DRAFT_531300 [Thozetella sp. PMI_491]